MANSNDFLSGFTTNFAQKVQKYWTSLPSFVRIMSINIVNPAKHAS